MQNWFVFDPVYVNQQFGFKPTKPAVKNSSGKDLDPWAYYYPTRVKLTLTDAIEADYPIAINFAGAAQGSVNIDSPNAPVILAGNIANPNGTTTITASSITDSSASASITSHNLTLTSSGGIGIDQTFTGTLNGTNQVTGIGTTTGLFPGETITGTGIAAGTTIQTINSSTTITLSSNAMDDSSETFTVLAPLNATLTQPTPTVSFIGTLTSGSNQVTGISNATGLAVGDTVTGTGTDLPVGTTIQALSAPSGLTLSAPANVTGPENLTAQTPTGVLNVTAGDQGVYLNLGSGALIENVQTYHSGGNVVINATGGLDPAPGLYSSILANNITLTSATGEVGSAAAPLVLFAEGVVNVTALDDIDLDQDYYVGTGGNLDVGQIVSTNGNVTINVQNGQIFGAAATPLAQAGAVPSQQLLLDLTNPLADENQTVSAFENQVDANYAGYWQLLENGSVQNGALTLTAGGLSLFSGPAALALAETFTGTLNGTNQVTGLSSTAGLFVGETVTGAGIPTGTTIASIIASTPTTTGTITLSASATQSGTGPLTAEPYLPAQLTNAQIETYANSQYQGFIAFFIQNLGTNWMALPEFATFNPSFSYVATQQQVSNLTSNAAWPSSDLSDALPQVGVNPPLATPVGVSTPNISGVNVTLISSASIGQTNAPIFLPLGDIENITFTGTLTKNSTQVTGISSTAQLFVGETVTGTGVTPGTTIETVNNSTTITLSAGAMAAGSPTLTAAGTLTSTQSAALAAASAPGEVNEQAVNAQGQTVTVPLGQQPSGYTVTGFVLPPDDQLFVKATGTLNMTAGGPITVQDTSGILTLGQVTASGAVNISSPGSILGTGSGIQIKTTGSTTLTAETAVGSSAAPLNVQIGGQLNVYAPAGDIFINGYYVTNTSVTASTSPATYGHSVTFTATVSDSGGGVPAGNVTFYEGETQLGQGSALSGSGHSATSTFTLSSLPVGVESLSAVYTPTGTFFGSSGSLSETVLPAPLTINVSYPGSSKIYGSVATFGTATFTTTGLVSGTGDSVTGVTVTSAGRRRRPRRAPTPSLPAPRRAPGSRTTTSLTHHQACSRSRPQQPPRRWPAR